MLFHSFICAQQALEKPGILTTISQNKEKGDTLKDVIKYDSDIQDHDLENKKSYLTGNASVEYTDMKIQADYIEINWKTNDVLARGKLNSLGKMDNITIFVQGNKKYEYDSLRFNFKTQKGLANNIRTEEQEGVIIAQKVKRENDSTNLMRNAFYTTDTYFREKKSSSPDYYLKTDKIKHISKKSIITGPILMYVYKIPTPLILPLSYIPITDKSSTGALYPRWGEQDDIGFFLENLGFFWSISEYWNSKITSSIYTNGSWKINTKSEYKVRYKYSGNVEFNYQTNITGTKGLKGYKKNNSFQLRWLHTQDSKANPSLIFSSNVNYVNSKNYYSNTLNTESISNRAVFTNTNSSNINLRKNFEELPITINLSGELDQNFNTKESNINLPNLRLTMQQRAPFQNKRNVFLHNLTINYNIAACNKVEVSSSQLFKKEMFEQMKIGTEHHLDLSTKTDLLAYFRFSPNLKYNEYWVLQTIEKYYNPSQDKVIELNRKGFKSFRTFDLKAILSFTLYGLKKFKEDSFIQVIRHKIDPQISYSYTPDFSTAFWGYYKSYTDKNDKIQAYSIFENGFYDLPSKMLSQKINFSMQNNLEMKVRNKNHTTGSKKIKLIESLNISTDYDIAKSSLKWGNISFDGNTTIIKNLKINIRANIDPYRTYIDKTDPTSPKSQRIDRWGCFTLKSFWFSLGYSMDNDTFKKENQNKNHYKKKGEIRYEKLFFDEHNYAHYKIPWHLDIKMSYNQNKTNKTASLKIDGNISPTPYWKIGFNADYDIIHQKITNALITFNRDLRSFNMSFRWGPVGGYKFWSFYIGIKASVLKDLKYEKKLVDSNHAF